MPTEDLPVLIEERPPPTSSDTPLTSHQLREDLLCLQERLEAITRAGEQVHEAAATDLVASQRLEHLTQRLRAFELAVRRRRRRARSRWPWLQALRRRRSYPAAPQWEHPADQALRRREEDTLRTLYRAGLLHR